MDWLIVNRPRVNRLSINRLRMDLFLIKGITDIIILFAELPPAEPGCASEIKFVN